MNKDLKRFLDVAGFLLFILWLLWFHWGLVKLRSAYGAETESDVVMKFNVEELRWECTSKYDQASLKEQATMAMGSSQLSNAETMAILNAIQLAKEQCKK